MTWSYLIISVTIPGRGYTCLTLGRLRRGEVAPFRGPRAHKWPLGDQNSDPMPESLFFHLFCLVHTRHLVSIWKARAPFRSSPGKIVIPPFLDWHMKSHITGVPSLPRREGNHIRNVTEPSSKEDEISCVTLKHYVMVLLFCNSTKKSQNFHQIRKSKEERAL